MAEKLSRKDLFSIFRRSLSPESQPPKPPELPAPLRPPSAADEDTIGISCYRCGACVNVCPRQAIKPLPAHYGIRAGTPHIVAREAPCVMCDGLLCTTVCPSGTLRPILRPTAVQMGLAEVNTRRCLPYRGEPCRKCYDHCPMPGALALDAQGRPRVTSACTGCGLCEYYCPTEPAAIRVRPRSAL
jgi:MauM/NapG family ferredoxin protein